MVKGVCFGAEVTIAEKKGVEKGFAHWDVWICY
jgi:hypothetical protein